MKKFLFTLAALLMAVTSFAQTDAKYLYVNTDLCEDLGINPATGDHEMLLVISAEFPAYLNAFEAEIHAPEGMTIDLLEVGEDCKVTYYNARGREQTWIPSISIGTGAADQSHFIIAGMQSGYDYVDGVLTDIITVKWAPGLHEEFILATAIIDDEVYNGGDIPITTKPASGRDPRTTITDLGDSQVPHETPATEPLPDPTPDVVAPAAPVITFSGEETTTMTVTVTAEEGCTLIVNGEEIAENTYTYTVTREDLYTEGTVEVTAKAVKDGVESAEASDSKAFVVKEKDYAPSPVFRQDGNLVYAELPEGVTGNYSIIMMHNGSRCDNPYILPPANYITEQTYRFVAYTIKDTEYYNSPNVEFTVVIPKLDPEPVATPEINYTMDADSVYVTVTWPVYTDGEKIYTGEYSYARPEYGQPDESYDVQAYTTAGTVCQASEVAEATIPVPAKDPVWQSVAAPVINYDVQTDKVVVTINWPTTTGNQIYTGEYEYARPEYGEPDQSYDVVAYTEADYPYSESAHATATIPVPAKAPVWQSVAAPVISYTMDADNVYVTINWPETTGEHKYNGEYTYARPEYGEADQSYAVEAYTEADYPYSESVHATETIPVPAKEQVVPGETMTFVKVASTADLVFGKKYIIVCGNKAMGVEATGNFLTAIDITGGDEVEIADNSGVAIMTLGGVTGYYTLELDGSYLNAANSTSLQFGNATEWAISDYNGTLAGFRVKHVSYNRSVRYSAGYDRFGNYSTSDQNSEYGWIYVEKSDTPEAPEAPVITFAGEETTEMTVTVTAEEGCTLIVNGEEIDSNTYTYTVTRDDIYTEGTVNVSAYAVKDGVQSEEATGSKDFVVEERPIADEPVIQFVETKEGNIVTEVEVVVTDATSHTVYVNGAQLRGEMIAASYDEVKNIHVEATNDPGYPEVAKSATGDYKLNKLVAAPVISTEVLDEVVNVTIVWPATEGTQEYTGEYTYERGDADQTFNVEAYTTAAGDYQESFHATETIVVPAKAPELTPDPVIDITTGKYNEKYVEITCEDPDAVIYYRTQYEDGNWSDWAIYDGKTMYKENGHYNIEAYAVSTVTGQSNTVDDEFIVSNCTAVGEVMSGKTISSVRYFNLAGQEMQEANGMTIIVTTYTDGTSSAVKVMK